MHVCYFWRCFKIKRVLSKHNIYGLLTGLIFGFLLQKGGITDYDVLVGQLLLKDFTVFKVILTAILTGMIGIYFLKSKKLVEFNLKPGSVATLITGGLIFGFGFGLLGYCPGTLVGAVGEGSLDALLAGVPGIIIGAGLFANIYPKFNKSFFVKNQIKKKSLLEYFDYNPLIIIMVVSLIIISTLILIELLT